MEGYEDFFGGTLTTIWSAPNYCYRCGTSHLLIPTLVQDLADLGSGNVAAAMEIDERGTREYNIFLACPANERMSLDLETNHKVPDYFL